MPLHVSNMCSKHVEAYNKSYYKTRICALSWLINKIRQMVVHFSLWRFGFILEQFLWILWWIKWHWDSVLNFDLYMFSGAVFVFLLLLNPSNDQGSA